MFNSQRQETDFEIIGWGLVCSQLTMFFLSVVLSIIASVLINMFSSLRDIWEGYIAVICAIGGVMPMLIVGIRNGSYFNMFYKREKMWPVQIILVFLFVIGLQNIMGIAMQPVEKFLEYLGFSFLEASNIATLHGQSFSMIFYSVIVAPFCEEFIYRGILLHSLERYGKYFAIIISALIFGLMHGNAVQFPVAFVIGTVFGYITLKYSLGVSIAIHILNNLSVEITGRIFDFNIYVGSALNLSMMIAGFLTIILMIMSTGKPILKDFQCNRTMKGTYKDFFLCAPVIAVFMYMTVLTVSSILK